MRLLLFDLFSILLCNFKLMKKEGGYSYDVCLVFWCC